ncbi:MAG: tetratricopeptide repeat-containing sensor histidine kinase [Bacteroidales bacterium]|nr:tetratricopeptide repeat-containing sensor histidine kinase [Bacteroidales bacterium]MCF8404204.1 tetratricopeptide repeat-containing sensor histidine kinase [Bacteroidales bacterium]
MKQIKVSYLVVLGLLFTLRAFAAHSTVQYKIDSLENILYNSLTYSLSNEEKIDICINLSELYQQVSREKQVEFAARALVLAEERNDFDNLVLALNLLSDAYLNLNKYEKSIEYSTRLYNIYNTNNNEIEAGLALNKIAESYYGWNKYIEAKDYYTRALNIFKKNQYFDGVAISSYYLAKILGHWGEYDEALTKSQEAIKFWEEIGNSSGMAKGYNGIGRLYQELGNLESAFEYYKKSLEIYEEQENSYEIVSLTLNIGDIYLEKKLYDKALEYYFKAEIKGKDLKNDKLKALTLGHIGQAYNFRGDYQKALDYQKRSLELKKSLGDKMSLSESYIDMGTIFLNIGGYPEALSFLNEGLDVASEINFKYQIINAHEKLSEVHQKLGNFDKALIHFKKYIEEKNKIYSEESKQTIAELRTKYELEKKDKENSGLRHGQQLKTVQIKNQQLVIGFVLFIFLGTVILSIILHSRYQQNQKLNIQLSLKNKEIEEQQQNVEMLNTELTEANKTKDKFFSIVAHDLKSPFNSLLVLTKLLLDDYETFTTEERKQFISQIKSSAENTYSLLENLLEWASAQSNKTVIVKEKINLSKISGEAITLLSAVAKNKNINLNSSISEEIDAYADKNMISTVLLNLMSNAVKFTPKNGQIEVHAFEKNNHVEVNIIDSGVGISEKNLQKLFKPDEKFQTIGTEHEKGTGLGLLLCKEFVEKNNGEIWVNSKEGVGSTFCFSLPRS